MQAPSFLTCVTCARRFGSANLARFRFDCGPGFAEKVVCSAAAEGILGGFCLFCRSMIAGYEFHKSFCCLQFDWIKGAGLAGETMAFKSESALRVRRSVLWMTNFEDVN